MLCSDGLMITHFQTNLFHVKQCVSWQKELLVVTSEEKQAVLLKRKEAPSAPSLNVHDFVVC